MSQCRPTFFIVKQHTNMHTGTHSTVLYTAPPQKWIRHHVSGSCLARGPHPYSLMRSVFRLNGTLLLNMAFLRRIRSNVERLTVWTFLNVAWSVRILVCICRSVIALFSQTIFTISGLFGCESVFFLHGVVLFQSCKIQILWAHCILLICSITVHKANRFWTCSSSWRF